MKVDNEAKVNNDIVTLDKLNKQLYELFGGGTTGKILDTRSIDYNPEHYYKNYPKQISYEMKWRDRIGIYEGGNVTLITCCPWDDTSVEIVQFAINSSGIYVRNNINSSDQNYGTWGEWRKI